MKKVIKLIIVLVVLGICGLYLYRFFDINNGNNNSYKIIQNSTEALDDSEKQDDFNAELIDSIQQNNEGLDAEEKIIWERIKYNYVPQLSNIKWNEFGDSIVVEDAIYTPNKVEITKSMSPSWNYDLIKADYELDSEGNLKNNQSFICLNVKIFNPNDYTLECWTNGICIHVYDKNGECITSGYPVTGDINKQAFKNFFRKILKGKMESEIELVYIIKDNELKKGKYYFIDICPSNAEPLSEENIGLCKLML